MDLPNPEDSYIFPEAGPLADRADQMSPALSADQIERIARLAKFDANA